ncbi:hypothetical protein GGD46_004334 [Rhizobium lusitanum]|uniref:Uncharacterized protein n=1 Tax=Rhizobium lusitanum TaxID=293958 RepID=A0A7X0IUF2_9HYPH|nr:hypothetical protein [Rhizobium lusitanum]
MGLKYSGRLMPPSRSENLGLLICPANAILVVGLERFSIRLFLIDRAALGAIVLFGMLVFG